jgi:hypothetical protein
LEAVVFLVALVKMEIRHQILQVELEQLDHNQLMAEMEVLVVQV